MNSNPSRDPISGDILSSQLVGWASLLMIFVSMSIITARLCDAPPLRSANDRSRWCTVWSLVERNTYQIDEIRKRPGWDSIDIVRHDGHFYSSKPALLPRMVAELYRGIKAITGWTLTEQTELVTRTILFLMNIVPMAIALVVWNRLIRDECHSPLGQLLLCAVSCFGTMVLPFLTVFNNHNVATSSFLIAIPLAIRCLNPATRTWWRLALCGALAAFGVCNELPAAMLGVGLFVVLVAAAPVKTLGYFVPAALVPLIAFFAANYEATGSWKPFYSAYGTETYNFVHEGVPSYWSNPKGIDNPRDSTLTYLFHCTIGHHGILSLSPIFLLTLIGWCMPAAYRNERLRWFQVMGVLMTLITLAFFLSRTQNYNYSGVTVALRWVLWLTPFWLLAMVPVVNAWATSRVFRGSSLVLLCLSTFSAWYPNNSPWTQNWIYRQMEQAKWIDYSDPRPVFQKKHLTWIGAFPDGETDGNYWIRYESTTPTGEVEQLELKDGGPANDGARKLAVRHLRGEHVVSEVTYLIDVQKFNSGAAVQDFLLGRLDGTEITPSDLFFFRGMPRQMFYVGSRIRYEKTDLRTDAIRAFIGFTNVVEKRTDGASLRVNRDVWFSEEVPFGTLKWEERVNAIGSGSELSRRVWTAVAVGKFYDRVEPIPF